MDRARVCRPEHLVEYAAVFPDFTICRGCFRQNKARGIDTRRA